MVLKNLSCIIFVWFQLVFLVFLWTKQDREMDFPILFFAINCLRIFDFGMVLQIFCDFIFVLLQLVFLIFLAKWCARQNPFPILGTFVFEWKIYQSERFRFGKILCACEFSICCVCVLCVRKSWKFGRSLETASNLFWNSADTDRR